MGKFVIKATKTGFTFSLKAGNGEIIATGGEVYSSLDSCKNGCASVAKNAPIAAIEDQTVEGFATEKNPKFEIYQDKRHEERLWADLDLTQLKNKNDYTITNSIGQSCYLRKNEGIVSFSDEKGNTWAKK